jgi:protein TonB
MSAHAGTFDDRGPMWNGSLKGPFWRSLALHMVVIGGFSLYAWWTGASEVFGDPKAGGFAVGIEVVKSIPLPSRGETNPVASDTKSTAPPKAAGKPAPKAAPEPPPPDAIALERTKSRPPAVARTLRSFDELASNQLTSRSLPALSSPMFAAVPGSGQIGMAGNTTLGTRFPAYAAQIRQLVQQNWRTADVDPAIKTAPRVTIVFELLRDGSTRNVRLTQKSGIPTLDFSVERAIAGASPFPPLPADYERNSIDVEFNFELRR